MLVISIFAIFAPFGLNVGCKVLYFCSSLIKSHIELVLLYFLRLHVSVSVTSEKTLSLHAKKQP